MATMSSRSPKEVAESYASSARQNFEKDGELAPILVLYTDERAATCLMNGTDDMPAAYGRTLALGAACLKPDYVITVTEVWMKTIEKVTSEKEARREMDKVRRGDLSREAEAGSKDVRTALMTVVWTMDPRQATSIIDKVLDDGTYDRNEVVGEQEGYMVDNVIGGWTHGLSLPEPPFDLPPELIAQVLGMGGDVVGVMFEVAG
jgi:hypothetical protein